MRAGTGVSTYEGDHASTFCCLCFMISTLRPVYSSLQLSMVGTEHNSSNSGAQRNPSASMCVRMSA